MNLNDHKSIDYKTIQFFFENVPMAMAINDMETLQYLAINKEFTHQTGFTKNEVIGKTPIDINIWPDTEESFKIKECIDKNGYVRNEISHIRTKSGDVLAWSFYAQIIEYESKTCILSYSVDMGKQHQAEKAFTQLEEHYEELVEFMPISMAIYDLKTKSVLFRNQTAMKLMEENDEPMVGRSVFNFVDESSIEDVKKRIELLMKCGEVPSAHEKFKTNRENIIDVEVSSKLIKYKGADASMILFFDISEQVYLEQQLQQSAKLEAIGLLAGGVAHDFNNILTVVRGHTELLIKRLRNEYPNKTHGIYKYVENKLEKIDMASEKAETLTKQLLAFGRKQILSPEIVNLNDVINSEINVLSTLIREDIELTKHLNPELGNCFVDTNQIGLVMINLMINARDAIPGTEKGQIIIETNNVVFDENHVEQKHQLIDKGQYIMFAVTDNGIGMDRATRERVFEPFFTTKELGKGVGLGLSTVYGIVKQSNGFIWVYSELGLGTTFKIYLPRIDKKLKGEILPSNYVDDLTGTETLLIVEDEKEVRLLVCEALREVGYKILCANNGIEAIEVVKKSQVKIDMVVTDVVMPKMDGRELIIQLNDLLPELKILYMSGYTDNTIVHRGILDSGTNFIQKPITPTSLTRKIREILDGT
jgi:PAS domain S-box-containing protein